jgi:hypothetical protein
MQGKLRRALKMSGRGAAGAEEPLEFDPFLEEEPVAGSDGVTVELSRPIEGPDDEVDAIIITDIAPPPPVEEVPDSGE